MKTYQKQIDATHPMEDSAGDAEMAADALAMKLVGERHEKRDLVNLVRWLILRADLVADTGKPSCPHCHGRGFVVYAAGGDTRRSACGCASSPNTEDDRRASH